MSVLIEDKATVAAIRRLAELKKTNVDEVLRKVIEAELTRVGEKPLTPVPPSAGGAAMLGAQDTTSRAPYDPEDKRPLRERLKDIQDAYARHRETGLKADKAFFDDLGGGL